MPAPRHLVLINTAANLVGMLTGPVLALVLVPFYLRHLGLESYGVIGFFTALQLVLAVFSQGMSMALQREVARRLAIPAEAPSLRRLIRGFELVYGAVAALLAFAIILSARWISRDWLSVGELDPDLVATALMLIAVRIALAFPVGLYQAVFVGTQRQVLGNVVNVAGASLLAAAIVTTVLNRPNLVALGMAEVAVGLVMLAAQRIAAFRILPAEGASSWWSARDLIEQLRLSAGLVWTSGSGVLITQMDRLLVGKWFPVSSLAVYNAGTAGGRLISMLYTPFLTAVYPETCRVVRTGSPAEVARLLHRVAGMVAAIGASAGMFLCFFSGEVLLAWTGNERIALDGPPVMSIYVLGNVVHAYASVFYLVQTAQGSVRYPAWFNAAALVWYPLALLALASRWGLAGAAACWLVYTSATLAWLAWASLRRLDVPGTAARYVRMIVGTALLGAGGMAACRQGADWAGWHEPPARILAGLSATALLFPSLLISAFGWPTFRHESADLFRRLARHWPLTNPRPS